MKNNAALNVTGMGRINSLQAVRAIAFLGIYLYHALRTIQGKSIVGHFFTSGLGPWGVSVFFVLSGFLMTYSYWNRPPKRSIKDMALFTVRKIRKLYPLHLIMLFFASVYLVLAKDRSFLQIFKKLIITIPLIQTWFPVGFQAINNVAWYLSVCLFLYFVFPYILPCIKDGSTSKKVIEMIAVYMLQLLVGYLLSHFTKVNIKWAVYCHPLYRTGDFVIGCLTASIFIYNRNTKKRGFLSGSFLEIIVLLCNIAVCALFTKIGKHSLWFAYTCMFTPTSVLLIYIFSESSGFLTRLLNNKLIFWLASISAYAFLIHRVAINYCLVFASHFMPWLQKDYWFVIIVPFAVTTASVYLYLDAEKRVSQINRVIIKHT